MGRYGTKKHGQITEYNFSIPDTKMAFANILLLAHNLGGRAYYQGASTTLACIFKGGKRKMENELRFYLGVVKAGLKDVETDGVVTPGFKPSYMVTAVKLPTGAIELATNTSNIEAKIDYILEAYDDDMKLKTNPEVEMLNLMIV